MKKNIYIICISVLFFSCKPKEDKGEVVIEFVDGNLNDSMNDFHPNSVITLELSITNKSNNNYYFMCFKDDEYYGKGSKLILKDTINKDFIEIKTETVTPLEKNIPNRSYAFINLIDSINHNFWNIEKEDKQFIKDREYTIEVVNNKLKTCKIYYYQSINDVNYKIERGNKNLKLIKDTIVTNSKLFIK